MRRSKSRLVPSSKHRQPLPVPHNASRRFTMMGEDVPVVTEGGRGDYPDEYEYIPVWCEDDSQTIAKKIQNRASCYYGGTCVTT